MSALKTGDKVWVYSSYKLKLRGRIGNIDNKSGTAEVGITEYTKKNDKSMIVPLERLSLRNEQ